MIPCISQATTLPSTFAEDIHAYAAAGWPAMEVWLTKLETHLETHSVSDTAKLIDDKGLALAAASYQGGLLLAQGEQRAAHFDHFRRRLELCQRFRIPTLVLATDFAQPVDESSIPRAIVSLTQAAQWATAFDVRLALEFRGSASACRSLATAIALVNECGAPNVGVNLDVFHYYTGPSKFEDLDLLTPANLAFVQVCDVAGVPRELMRDADRVLPGDGDFQLEPIIAKVRQCGYAGHVSLELMNPTIWQTKATQVAEIGMASLSRLLRSV